MSPHADAERRLLAAGWTRCGAGDWAVALRSPDGTAAARISPFDPTGPYTAELYRTAAPTRRVPALIEHRRLPGGGDLMIMEWPEPAGAPEAAAFLRSLATGTETTRTGTLRAGSPSAEVAEPAVAVRRIHDRARREPPWCGPLDANPATVRRRRSDGRLVAIDLFYADGPALYAAAESDPAAVAARIPEEECRYLTEIPLAASGPWAAEAREAVRAGLAAAYRARGIGTTTA